MEKYSKEQINWLIDNNKKYKTYDNLKEAFNKEFNTNRSWSSIKCKCYHLKLSKIENLNLFSKKESQWIIDNFYNYDDYYSLKEDYEKVFNKKRSYCTFKHFIRKLGLKSNRNFTKEQNQWLIDNIDKYSRKELAINFNEKFNQKRNSNVLAKHCNKKLKIYFTTNIERYKNNMIKSRTLPIGTEIKTKSGYTLVKVNNLFKNSNKNWQLKERFINNAKEDEDVIIINKDKDITKDNTMVVKKGTIAIMTKKGYHNLPDFIKTVAIKTCELQAIHSKIAKKPL